MNCVRRFPIIAVVLLFAAVWAGNRIEAKTSAKPVATDAPVQKVAKPSALANAYVGKVTRVSDGDTIWITTDKGVRVKVRLSRIDAPESDQPFGKNATEFLKSLIGGKQVRVEYEECDQYGRTLGIVFLGGEDINLKLVSEGYAWHYSYFDQTPAYAEAERTAKAAKKGLWASPNPINPYRWRKGDR